MEATGGSRDNATTNPLIERVAQIYTSREVKQLAAEHKLDVSHVAWEDCARYDNSCWGPCISDVTLCTADTAMPIIRSPNFQDTTVDMPIDKINLIVGNEVKLEAGEEESLGRTSLKEFLENIDVYTGNDKLKSLYRPRDASVVVSPQACVLPLTDGQVSFNARIFSYQSRKDDPAVLVIMGTNQGTSTQVVHGTTNLYFNEHGKSVDFLARRLVDDRKKRGVETQGEITTEEKNRNVIYIIQVPLKTKAPPSKGFGIMTLSCLPMAMMGGPALLSVQESVPLSVPGSRSATRGADWAMLEKSTEVKGDYPGTRGLELERDDRFPIRLTVQIYTVTDESNLAPQVMKQIAERLEAVKTQGVNEGSLVVDGKKGRPTEHDVKRPKMNCALCHKPMTSGKVVIIDGEIQHYCSKGCAHDATEEREKGKPIKTKKTRNGQAKKDGEVWAL